MKETHRLIDIHSHVIFGVDDGAQSQEDTEELLKESYAQGVRTIIATPHRRRGMFEADIEKIKENFKVVEELAKEISPDFNIYLGSEIFYKEGELSRIEEGKYPTLAETDYVLVEFSYEISFREMKKALNGIILLGLAPVVAHIERYACLEKDLTHIQELINMGCYMQVNAASVLKAKLIGDKHKHYKKRAKKYLDSELVHFIATDMHNMTTRKPHLKEAYDIIEKKYGTAVAYELFEKNAERLLMNKII